MVVFGFWLPVTLNILFNLVKSVSIVLSGQFYWYLWVICHHFFFNLINLT